MAYVGATSGLVDIFVLPVLLHLKILRAQIDDQVKEMVIGNDDSTMSFDAQQTCDRRILLKKQYRK